MKFGLSDDQLRQIQAVLAKYPAITEAVVFGSRAMGNYKEASDVDVALKGNITLSMVADVKYALEEDSYLPFFFDIIAYGIIDAPKLKEHIDRYGEVLYRAGWKACRVGDCSLINSKNIDKNYPHNEIEYLDTGSITQGKIEALQHFQLGDAPSRAKRIVKDNDIVVSMVRPIQRHYGFLRNVPENMVASTGFVVVTCKEDVDPYFLYSFLTQQETTEHLDMIAEGSTSAYPAFTPDVLENLVVNLPPLPEQRAIAAVLSSLDDKINLLHRQNKTLEGMASALWRKMFIEEALPNWKMVKLGTYVECINGVSYTSEDLRPSKTAMVTLKNFDRNGGFKLDGFKKYAGKHKEQHLVVQGDLLVAHTDITQNAEVIGNPVLVVADPRYNKLIFSMDLVKVIPKVKWLSKEFLYQMVLTEEFKQHCLGYSNGSTVLHLSKKAIPSYEFLRPPDKTIEEFTVHAKSILTKIFENIQQIRNLEKLRDTLLPKLISGETRVKI